MSCRRPMLYEERIDVKRHLQLEWYDLGLELVLALVATSASETAGELLT